MNGFKHLPINGFCIGKSKYPLFKFTSINGFYCFTLIESLARIISWILHIFYQWLLPRRVEWDFKYPLMVSSKLISINGFYCVTLIRSLNRLKSRILDISHRWFLHRRVESDFKSPLVESFKFTSINGFFSVLH